jgi:hypothetical protein
MIQICVFKEEEKKEGGGRPHLGGPWNVLCLVALEMNLMLKGQWGNILLGGQWKVPSLVALGMVVSIRLTMDVVQHLVIKESVINQ